jgi:Raf kinase inhibitor-like YbhB/YbcL family protein
MKRGPLSRDGAPGQILAALVTLVAAGWGYAHGAERTDPPVDQTPRPAKVLSLARLAPRAPRARLRVTSMAFATNSAIPMRDSGYGDSISPPLRWTPARGARTYALILEDPDAPTPAPFVHWIIWNIPADVTALAAGVPKTARLANPPGAEQGRNGRRSIGYFGPHPPGGDPPHHYHFQIFALDRSLSLDPETTDRDTLAAAMEGHVLGEGELVGLFRAP